MTLESGKRLGPYEVLAPLGAGGMGEVYRARDTRLSREVAIKVLPAEVASDPSRLKRFENEARSASSLNHPSIVTIYEIGQADSVSYIAMELVEGKTLRELVAAGALPVKKLLQIGSQMADGLARAHEAGIVHRDLKPENVMVTKDGLVKILDFGLAKLTYAGPGSGGETNLPTLTATTPGVVMGTVGYMSPEQAGGQLIDFRSDQFSFGSILYEMATGKSAFQKGTAWTRFRRSSTKTRSRSRRPTRRRPRRCGGSSSGASPRTRRTGTPRRETSPGSWRPSGTTSPRHPFRERRSRQRLRGVLREPGPW